MVAAGMNPNDWTKLKIRVIVSRLAGASLSQSNAWLWLRSRYAEGQDGLPSVPKKDKGQWKKSAASSKDFYASAEWRMVRFEALKKANGCCSLCGRSNRLHSVVLHVDHIKPRSKYPHLSLDIANLQILCEDCNLGKGARDETDWRSEPEVDCALDAVDWKYH